MSLLRDALRATAQRDPNRIALQDEHTAMTYGELNLTLDKTVEQLSALNLGTLGLIADNSLAWALVDLAAYSAYVPLVPVPLFFSSGQMLHVISNTGLDGLLTDRPLQIKALLSRAGIPCEIAGTLAGLQLVRMQSTRNHPLPIGTLKITYTSGTTGEPKGVCLSRRQIETVAVMLQDACQANLEDAHLCVTPLSTLLENIGGIYVPLLAGARSCLPSLQHVGLRGATELDVTQMLQALRSFEVTSTILAPQMLQAVVAAITRGASKPPHLRFVAVGGAPVSVHLLQQAMRLGIPVFQGYGLSECASVVALNTPQNNRLGSVGRPLAHIALSFAEDGEILINHLGFLGYLGQNPPQSPWPTGDWGYLDADGFLYITGRKKNIFITSYGRNVAPEWVESELTLHAAIAQAAVFGDAQPFNIAVIVPRTGFSDDDIQAAVEQANQSLPDYARVTTWVAASAPFSIANAQLTSNGRLKREFIRTAYAREVEEIYQENTHDVF